VGFAGGDSELYRYCGSNPVNVMDPTGFTWASNWNFFWDWALGGGQNKRSYGPNDVETEEMKNSIGAEKLRGKFYKEHCRGFSNGAYGTVEAYWDTTINPFTLDWSSTAAQVGGFGGATATNNGNGTVTFSIPNSAGTHSFFLHIPPDMPWTDVPMRTIDQQFQWTEPIKGGDCGCK
jgi:hypothetical protein